MTRQAKAGMQVYTALGADTSPRDQRGGLEEKNALRRMRFTTQWRAAFRVKSFKAAVIRKKWLEGGERGEVVVGDLRSLVEEPRRRDVDI